MFVPTRRYWSGKAPDWAADEPEELVSNLGTTSLLRDQPFLGVDVVPSFDISSRDDPRLRRLHDLRVTDRDVVRADHLRVRLAEAVSSTEDDEEENEDDEDDEDLLEEKRRRIRETNLRKRQCEEESELLLLNVDEDDDESEYETVSDDDVEEFDTCAMVKPVFVRKHDRETMDEKERMDEAERKSNKKQKLEERETKQIVVELIREEESESVAESEAEVADDDIDNDEAEEYESWKLRELARIKQYRYDREAMSKEKEKIEIMTEEERREWERKHPKQQTECGTKRKWEFMQRYYHKGAFYQDDGDDRAAVIGRDFSAPTVEDKLNKTVLPKLR